MTPDPDARRVKWIAGIALGVIAYFAISVACWIEIGNMVDREAALSHRRAERHFFANVGVRP